MQNHYTIKCFEIEIEKASRQERERLKITSQKVLKEFLSGSTEEGFSCWLEKSKTKTALPLSPLFSDGSGQQREFGKNKSNSLQHHSTSLSKSTEAFSSVSNRTTTHYGHNFISCNFSGTRSLCNIHWTCDCSLVIFTPLLRLCASMCMCVYVNW